jgi:hypothetical protein
MILTKSPIFLPDPADPMLGLAHVLRFSQNPAPVGRAKRRSHLAAPSFYCRFPGCDNLKVAKGSFPGSVGFKKPGLEKTRNLITRGNQNGMNADFRRCNIRLGTEFLGHEYQMDDTARQKNLWQLPIKSPNGQPEIEF